MDKSVIIDAIKRTAETNAGVPLGRERFRAETGIKIYEWQAHWARWGDALRDAGFPPNTLQRSFDREFLLTKCAELARELGALPTHGDLTLRGRNDPSFPGKGAFGRFGSKEKLVCALAEFCAQNAEFGDVRTLCDAYLTARTTAVVAPLVGRANQVMVGYVYLMRSGRHFKIGRTNAAGRRERELAIQLPEKAETVHVISTDDPTGIEAYWHKRFEAKRQNGEWFALDRDDVAAFKRRRFM